MADLAELVVRIKADASALEREMKKAQGVVQNSSKEMQSSLSGVAAVARTLGVALSVGAVINFGKNALQAADRLNDLAQRTGVLGSTLSALNIPLQQGGSSVEEFASSITRMNNMVGEAANGSQQAVKAFDDIGLSVRALQQMSPEDQFFAVAKALSEVDSQSEMTNAGMAIFGRGFATLIPLIKDTNGNLADFVKTQKEAGEALNEEELQLIDEWGDRWTAATARAGVGLIKMLDSLYNIRENTARIEESTAIFHKLRNQGFSVEDARAIAKNSTSGVDISQAGKGKASSTGAKGGNAGLLVNKEVDTAKKSLADYNTELKRQSEYSQLTPSEQKARKAYYDTLDLAQKAGVKNAEALAEANAEVARSNDLMNQKMRESARFSAELKDQFSQTAADIIFGAKSAGDALKGLGEALAKMILQRGVLGPLSDSLFGSPGSGSSGIFGSMFSSFSLPSFDVGSPYVPRDMIAQIHKGERIVPANQNNASGMAGSNQVINQTFNFQTGVTRSELSSILPQVANAARNAVFSDIQRGGSAAKIVGAR